jgi:hypothetical protein
MMSNESLPTQALDAWAQDTQARERTMRSFDQPLLQVEVIPLACAWSLAKKLSDNTTPLVYDFSAAFIAHAEASACWERLALRAGDPVVETDVHNFSWLLSAYDTAEDWLDPYSYDRFALTNGRPEATKTITGLELSLVFALGHAAYNSTSGSRLIILEPLGPPPRPDVDATTWVHYGGPILQEFAKTKLNIKADQ